MKHNYTTPVPTIRPLIWNKYREPFVSFDETNFCIDILHGKTHLTTLRLYLEDEKIKREVNCIHHIPSYAKDYTEEEVRNPINYNHVVATFVEKYCMFIIRHSRKISCILLPPGTQFQPEFRELSLAS